MLFLLRLLLVVVDFLFSSAFLDAARQQADSRDYAGALRSIENGLRLDAGNRDLVNLKSRVQPLFEREEKQRKAGLSPVERMKVRNVFFGWIMWIW